MPSQGRLRRAFDETTKAANTEAIDAMLVASGRLLADHIDRVVAESESDLEITKALYLIPHVVNILREMLATPASRAAMKKTGEEAVGGKLAQLRAVTKRVGA